MKILFVSPLPTPIHGSKLGPIGNLHVNDNGIFSFTLVYGNRSIDLLGTLDGGVQYAGQFTSPSTIWPGLVIPMTTIGEYFSKC